MGRGIKGSLLSVADRLHCPQRGNWRGKRKNRWQFLQKGALGKEGVAIQSEEPQRVAAQTRREALFLDPAAASTQVWS